MKRLAKSLWYSLYVMFHPFKGFWDLKYEKHGTWGSSVCILSVLILTFIMRNKLTEYLFVSENLQRLNIFKEIVSVILPFTLWCAANWGLTTLMDGEGSIKDVIISVSHSLAPLAIINMLLVLLSHVLVLDEMIYYSFFQSLSLIWTVFLVLIGMMIVHQYSMKKTIFTSILTVVGMGILIFVGMLFISLIQQMTGFVGSIYKEILFRL